MRLRNIKNKEEIIKNSPYIVENSEEYKGKWSKLFNNNNPIYIEIGMGMGKFIRENAIKRPDINFIGIEKEDKVLARSLPLIEENIDNLKILRLNALEIDKVFANEIDNIYLNFSDPWPKLRHNKRRLTSKIFLEKYEHIFKSNITKTIELRTDNEELFIYSLETLSTAGYHLSNITFDLNATTPERITTEYEDKFSERGNKIYYLKASK